MSTYYWLRYHYHKLRRRHQQNFERWVTEHKWAENRKRYQRWAKEHMKEDAARRRRCPNCGVVSGRAHHPGCQSA